MTEREDMLTIVNNLRINKQEKSLYKMEKVSRLQLYKDFLIAQTIGLLCQPLFHLLLKMLVTTRVTSSKHRRQIVYQHIVLLPFLFFFSFLFSLFLNPLLFCLMS